MKKILIVDDDKDILTIVKHLLKSYGFDVHTHSTGLHVAEEVEKYNPNLILLDVMLPGKLGTEICKELKSSCTIPVILFSAHADKAQSIRDCRADAFISKPFDIMELVDEINRQLN